ncbi:MAG: tetratricopeptide repeat protein [Candidatus Sumerlaeaceae bacterium]
MADISASGDKKRERRTRDRRSKDQVEPPRKDEGSITQALRVQFSGALERFPWLHRPLPYQLGIIALVFAVFARALTFDFVNLDDNVNIYHNPLLHPPTLQSLSSFWRAPYQDLYVPLFYTSLWFDQLIGGGRPWVFHLTNLLLHIASALLVMGILRRVAESFAFLEALPVPHKEYRKLAAATVGALVFACHPAQAEAVCWVTGRKDVLAGCLSLAAIYAYLVAAGPAVDLHGLTLQQNFRVRGRSYWLALLFFLLALLAKPASVMLPFMILGINTLLLRRPLRKAVYSLIPWFFITGLWIILTLLAQDVPAWIRQLVPWWKRPLLAADSLVFYIRLMLWPRNLVPVYPRTAPEAVTGIHCWVDIAIVGLALVAAAYTSRRGYRVLPSIVLLFVIPLVPVLGLMPFLYEAISTVANRYLYLSLLSLAIIYAWMWLAAASHPIPRARRSLAAGLVLVAIGHALSQTPAQIRNWRNSQVLWDFQMRIAPGAALPHANLGQLYAERGDKARAEDEYRQAYHLDEKLTPAMVKHALLLLERGEYAPGTELLHRAVRSYREHEIFDIRLAEAHNNLGVAYMRQSKWTNAAAEFEAALHIQPGNDTFRQNLQDTLRHLPAAERTR